ncbi:MAG: hypothetical protein ACE5IO_09960, partial [Thermoplasmata archaeon]
GEVNHGTGIVEVDLDKASVLSGQSLSVTVNVTLSQLGGGSSVGVFLVSSQTGLNDQPSSQGWKIVQDPNGGTSSSAMNYVEKDSPGAGSTVSFRWSLEAPPTPGSYNLFVRVHHGSVARNALWEDYVETISVEVSPLPPGLPVIHHDPVSEGYVEEPIPMRADVINATKVFLHWRKAGETQFESIEMINTSEESENGWIFEDSIPPQGFVGKIEYQIIANRETGDGSLVNATSIFTLSIEERPEIPNVTAWIIQLVIVSEVILFASIIVIRMMMVKSKRKKEDDQDV